MFRLLFFLPVYCQMYCKTFAPKTKLCSFAVGNSMLLKKPQNFHTLFNPKLVLDYFEVFTYIKLLKFEACFYFFLVNLEFYFTVIKYSGSCLDICITLVMFVKLQQQCVTLK